MSVARQLILIFMYFFRQGHVIVSEEKDLEWLYVIKSVSDATPLKMQI